MNCADTLRLLNAHADSELDVTNAIAVEEHLEACPGCRRAFREVQAARDAVARHAEAPPAPEDLRERLSARLRAPAGGRLRALLRSPLAIAAPGIAALGLAAWVLVAGPLRQDAPAQRVVYHITSSDTAGAALRTLGNHLQAAPEGKFVVVAHNNGVDFLLDGARDESGQPFEAAVREFGRRGVEFRVCLNTLERRGITAARVIPEARVVPSGIAEIGRLQAREGYAYMRM